VSLFKLQLFK